MRPLPRKPKLLKGILKKPSAAVCDQEKRTACWPWTVLSAAADEEEETAMKAKKPIKAKKKVTFSQSSTSSTAANKHTIKGIDKKKRRNGPPQRDTHRRPLATGKKTKKRRT